MRNAPKLAVLSGWVMLVGCGDSGPFQYVPIEGKVSYEDGTLIDAPTVRLTFTAVERGDNPNLRPRPANTSLNVADGTFDNVTSYKYGDGLVPGKHRVAIVALGEKGNMLNLVPADYTNSAKSPLIIDTKEAPLDIRIPKPKS